MAVGILMGAAVTATIGYIDFQYSNETSTYDRAPVCPSDAITANCRFEGQGRVVRKWTNSNGDLAVDLVFVQLNGKAATAFMDKTYMSQWQRWQQGMSLNVELWKGTVTVIDGIRTGADPDLFPNAGIFPVIFFGVPTLILVAGLMWMLQVNRNAARRPA
jgi:hypothetical protein